MWKDIKGYEGIYRINQAGDVLSVKRNIIKKQRMHRDGYLHLDLSNESRTKSHYIHRLIAEAFLQNPFNKPQINHKNGDRLDNRIENLEWVNPHENSKHRFRNIKRRKITMNELHEIYLKSRNNPLIEVSKECGIPASILAHLLKYMHPDY